jgi:hypothetical protein
VAPVLLLVTLAATVPSLALVAAIALLALGMSRSWR